MARRGGDTLEVRTSKQLAYLLRHGAAKEGLAIRDDGFVRLQDILERPYFRNNRIGVNEIQTLVENSDKKRFKLIAMPDENGSTNLFIRASQGHSLVTVNDEKLLRKLDSADEFPQVVHGTYFRFWEKIKREGLRTMARNHVHFAPGYPSNDQVISGMRSSCEVVVEIDLKKALEAGMEFHLSDNNVILTRGFDGVVPPTFFKRVVDKRGSVLEF